MDKYEYSAEHKEGFQQGMAWGCGIGMWFGAICVIAVIAALIPGCGFDLSAIQVEMDVDAGAEDAQTVDAQPADSGPQPPDDAGPRVDAGRTDAGVSRDGGPIPDAGPGPVDAGAPDAGSDAGSDAGCATWCSGSCVDTSSSNEHCGMCGRACEAPMHCVSGLCAL